MLRRPPYATTLGDAIGRRNTLSGASHAHTPYLPAAGVAFTTAAVTAPANTPFTIKFTNNDSGTPHNIVIHGGPTATDPVIFDGEIFSGVDSRLYAIPALKPGTYAFNCKVHPSMIGTLTVQ